MKRILLALAMSIPAFSNAQHLQIGLSGGVAASYLSAYGGHVSPIPFGSLTIGYRTKNNWEFGVASGVKRLAYDMPLMDFANEGEEYSGGTFTPGPGVEKGPTGNTVSVRYGQVAIPLEIYTKKVVDFKKITLYYGLQAGVIVGMDKRYVWQGDYDVSPREISSSYTGGLRVGLSKSIGRHFAIQAETGAQCTNVTTENKSVSMIDMPVSIGLSVKI